MDFNTIYLFLIILHLEHFCVKGIKELLYFSEGKTWVEARSICRSMNGQLMMSNALNRNIISNCQEIRTNQRFWVGEYKSLSPWFQIIDCFSGADVNYNATFDNSFRNEVSVCHRVCNTTYVGLQGQKCHCINDDFNGVQNTASAQCDRICDGNSAEYCGGSDVINVYRTVEYSPSEDICPFGDICLCTQMDCQVTGVAYSARPCQERIQGACGDRSISDVRDTWSASNDRCSLRGYLTNQDGALDFCQNRPSAAPESYWTGVFRSAIHNYDQAIPIDDEELLYCFTLTKGVIYDSTRSDAREMDTCYQKRLPFVCEIGSSTFGQAYCSLYTTPSTESKPGTTTSVLQNSTFIMGQNNQQERDIVDIGLAVALATGSGLVLLLVVLVVCVVQRRRDTNYRRKFKTPFIINSYGKDVNLDAPSPEKTRQRSVQAAHPPQRNSPLLKREEKVVGRQNDANLRPRLDAEKDVYSRPTKKLPKLVESEIYVVSSDCDENDVIPKPRPKKGIMKKPAKNFLVETDSGIDECKQLKKTYDADTSSYSDESCLQFKSKNDNVATIEGNNHGHRKSPYEYVYSEW